MRLPSAEASGGPPWTSAPLQSSITGTPRRPAGCPASQTTLPLLDFLGPTTQSQTSGPVRPRRIPPPQRAASGVWIPPSRTPPLAHPALARWSVHGLHPSRTSPRRDRCPSRGPCLLDVTRPADAPVRGRDRRGRLQGLLPATRSCSRRNHKGSDRRSLPGVHPSRACSRSAWRSLSSRRLPSRPWDGLTSRPAWASGYCGANKSGDPSPDPQLSWVCLPFGGRGAPCAAPRGGLMLSPHAFPRLRAGRRSMPLGYDATANPGLAARHRRPSVYDR